MFAPLRPASSGASSILARLRIFTARASGGADLPVRVTQAISEQQESSEIIIGWVQAFAIIGFGALYAISPKAFPPTIPFEPVPLTLAAYACFVAARLWLAHRHRLSRGMVAASVIIDMAVLMVTIWSFHLQYQTPPALYLKAPTLMYAFILIALRGLRFEPGYVVLAGIAAAFGWLALVGYALLEPGGVRVTRSYTEYATSYSILIGAEMDKIISILVVTAILALSLKRSRELLRRAIAEQVMATALSRFFAPEVAAQIRASEALRPGRGERRHAAIMTIDLRGFTALSHRLAAPDLIALLGEYQNRLVPIIQRNGGSIDKYLGEGILASFGAVVPSTTYAADACRAAAEVARKAEAWKAERATRRQAAPSIGTALAAGEIIFGLVGHESRLEYTVIGEVVAAKLEKHTKREGVIALTTRETYELALRQGCGSGEAETRPGRIVEGIADPIDLVVLGTRAEGRDNIVE
jgi:adenylate cyclase